MGSPHEPAGPVLPPRLAESTPYLLTRAVRRAARLAQGHFSGEGLRFPHYAALCWIEHLGQCAQRELADAMDSDPSDLVTVLAALENAALLDRGPDPADRRRNILTVTDAGRTWLRERHERARTYDTALCSSTRDDGATLRRHLTALLPSHTSL